MRWAAGVSKSRACGTRDSSAALESAFVHPARIGAKYTFEREGGGREGGRESKTPCPLAALSFPFKDLDHKHY